MFDRASFVIGEAMQNLRRHGFMTFAAIAVVAISLTIIGGLAYAYAQAADYARTVPGRFDMYVLLKFESKGQDISETATAIRKMPGVRTVSWIPKDKAWARQRRLYPQLTEGIDNPLPDAFKVVLSDLGRGDTIADEIRQLPAVDSNDGVRYMSEEQRMVQQGLRFLQWIGSLGLLLFVVAGILIYNTIRMAAMSRKTEVRIMRLVGASRATIAVPFLLEGLIEGTIGGFLSAMFVWGAWRILSDQFASMGSNTTLALANTSAVTAPQFPLNTAVFGLTLLGALYGCACSLIALRLQPETR